jgi:addiction module HigA family antidote
MKNGMRAIHPGEILLEEFIVPLGLSRNKVAKAIGVPVNRVAAIVNGERSVTAGSALRLGRLFGTTPEFWLNLQQAYDLKLAQKRLGRTLEKEIEPIERVAASVVA